MGRVHEIIVENFKSVTLSTPDRQTESLIAYRAYSSRFWRLCMSLLMFKRCVDSLYAVTQVVPGQGENRTFQAALFCCSNNQGPSD